jgi:palmitoyl-protein thioesterase
VEPKDSSWFGFYNGTALVPLREQPLYSEDWLGLRALDQAGRLAMDAWPGGHMQFSLSWFEQQVVDKYLRKL